MPRGPWPSPTSRAAGVWVSPPLLACDPPISACNLPEAGFGTLAVERPDRPIAGEVDLAEELLPYAFTTRASP